MDAWSALEHLALATGPSGYEQAAAVVAAELFQPLCDEIRQDALGNVIACRKATRAGAGETARIMLAAHMDEIALMVLKIEKDGFLRVTPVGGVDLRCLPGLEVTVHGRQALPGVVGSTPPHLTAEADRGKAPKWEEVYIDIGFPYQEAQELVSTGDLVTFNAPFARLLGERAAGKAFDDRAGVAVLWETLQGLQRRTHAVDIYAVATVQEEVGLRGAVASAFHLVPQAGIAIDVGFGTTPGLNERDSLALGKGPGVTLGGNIHPAMRKRLMSCAKQENVPVQVEVSPGSSGTDAWGMQVTQAGMPTAVISLPLRYMHSPVECLDLQDLQMSGRLLAAFLSSLESEEVWGWGNGPA